MKRFLLKVALFSILISCAVYAMDYMVQEGIKEVNFLEVGKWAEIIEGGIDAEVLIVGSSRAIGHFDTPLMEEHTGKSSYNLGIDGITYPYQKIILDLYLEKNKLLNQIIWALDYHSFKPEPDFQGFDRLIPFQTHPKVKALLALTSKSTLELGVPLYRYSYSPSMKIKGLLGFFGWGKREQIIIKGYRPPKKQWDEAAFRSLKAKNQNGIAHRFEQDIFEDFIRLNQSLQSKGITQSWVVSPYFKAYNAMITNREAILSQYRIAADQLQIPLIDLSEHPISQDKRNFYNANHLSKQGVEKFMEVWIEK